MEKDYSKYPVWIGLLLFLAALNIPLLRMSWFFSSQRSNIEDYVMTELDHRELQSAGEDVLDQILEKRWSFSHLNPIPLDELPLEIRNTNPIAVRYVEGFLYIQYYPSPFIGVVIGDKNSFISKGKRIQPGINYIAEQ